jgi:hypothetical protein
MYCSISRPHIPFRQFAVELSSNRQTELVNCIQDVLSLSPSLRPTILRLLNFFDFFEAKFKDGKIGHYYCHPLTPSPILIRHYHVSSQPLKLVQNLRESGEDNGITFPFLFR